MEESYQESNNLVAVSLIQEMDGADVPSLVLDTRKLMSQS